MRTSRIFAFGIAWLGFAVSFGAGPSAVSQDAPAEAPKSITTDGAKKALEDAAQDALREADRQPAGDAAAAPAAPGEALVDLDDLKLLVKPLTKDELKVEADAWMAKVQAKIAATSRAEIAARRAEGEEKSRLIETATRLDAERIELTDRLRIVLDALKARGGSRDDYDAYLNAVSGVSVSPTDVSTMTTVLTSWLKSPQGGVRYGRNIALFLVTLIVFRIAAGLVGGIMRQAMGRMRTMSQLLRDFAINAVRNIIVFVGFVVALSMLEVNIGPFLAAMGAVGFIVGFALQGTLSNFAAGVMILLYRPYDLGDKVTLAGQTGVVKSMTLVSTVLRNDNQHSVVVPNSAIWGGTIVNLGAPTPG